MNSKFNAEDLTSSFKLKKPHFNLKKYTKEKAKYANKNNLKAPRLHLFGCKLLQHTRGMF